MMSTATKPKGPCARPTNYRPENGRLIADAMVTGLSVEAAASCVVRLRTTFAMQRQHEEFCLAVEDGKARYLLFWERRVIALASVEAGIPAVVALRLKNWSRVASGWHDAQRPEQMAGRRAAPSSSTSRARCMSPTLNEEQLGALEMALLAMLGPVGGNGGIDDQT